MKSILILALFTFSLCLGGFGLAGGWSKRSILENSLDIDQSFKLATAEYTKTTNVDADSLVRLTVYSQVVSGSNYKVTFINPNTVYPVIQEYVVYIPLRQSNNKIEITDHKEYKAENGVLAHNDSAFSELEKQLYDFLKNTKEKLIFISYVIPVENNDTRFFMISAFTGCGQHQYIICQEKSSGDYYLTEKLR